MLSTKMSLVCVVHHLQERTQQKKDRIGNHIAVFNNTDKPRYLASNLLLIPS